jgi:hypothetical protein
MHALDAQNSGAKHRSAKPIRRNIDKPSEKSEGYKSTIHKAHIVRNKCLINLHIEHMLDLFTFVPGQIGHLDGHDQPQRLRIVTGMSQTDFLGNLPGEAIDAASVVAKSPIDSSMSDQ